MTPCDQCTRGWIPDGDWYKACPVCNGASVLTAARMAKLLDIDEMTLKGFWMDRRKTRRKTLEKILSKVCALLEPKRAKQLRLGEIASGVAAVFPEILPPQFLPTSANDYATRTKPT